MRKIIPFPLFESISSGTIDSLVDDYSELPKTLDVIKKQIGKYSNLDVVIVEPSIISAEKPEWNNYKGSHHWGKKTGYIPENEIWIVSGLTSDVFRRILNHEIIEREMMRALQDEHGMDTESSWKQAHYYVKQMGF
jgi:hypothetical protein